MSNLDKAIEHFGGKTQLAMRLGIHPMTITQWKKRGIPPKRAKQIADASGGAIKPTDLLPELFG